MQEEKQYPCDKCGKLRTAEEGGTTFTVCDDCWDYLSGLKYPPADNVVLGQKSLLGLLDEIEQRAAHAAIDDDVETVWASCRDVPALVRALRRAVWTIENPPPGNPGLDCYWREVDKTKAEIGKLLRDSVHAAPESDSASGVARDTARLCAFINNGWFADFTSGGWEIRDKLGQLVGLHKTDFRLAIDAAMENQQ